MSSPVPPYRDEITLLGLVVVLLRQRWLLLLPLIGALGALLLVSLRQRYVAESSFVPDATRKMSTQLAGLASQFGLNVGGPDVTESEDFYVELLKSRELRDSLADTRFTYARGPQGEDSISATLWEIMGIHDEARAEMLRRMTNALDQAIRISSSPRTRIVKIRVSMRNAELAQQMNRRMLDLVSRFNLYKRQLRAAAERKFVESRVTDAQGALRLAEGELERFLVRNRRYQDSPELVFEAGRLQRQVEIRQMVFQTLSQSYEQSRIDEVRNTPLITIIDSPEGSAQPKWQWKMVALLGFALGCVLALLAALATEHLRRQRLAMPEEYKELKELGRLAFLRFGGGKG
jgi:uncharacterized protein involved in exopolysaccharide biosynthesis